MSWKKQGVELPEGVHKIVAKRAREIAGDSRGFARYVWTAAAMSILDMEPGKLHALAAKLRDESEKHKGLGHLFRDGKSVAIVDLLSETPAVAGEKSAKELRERGRKTREKRVTMN